MNKLEQIKLKKLEQTEAHLRELGCEKCSNCLRFMDKKYIANGKCVDC